MYFNPRQIQYTTVNAIYLRKKVNVESIILQRRFRVLSFDKCEGIFNGAELSSPHSDLARFRNNHKWYFSHKMDNFWDIERLWATLAESQHQSMWRRWCVVFEKLFGRQNPKLWQSLFIRFQQGWTRFLRWSGARKLARVDVLVHVTFISDFRTVNRCLLTPSGPGGAQTWNTGMTVTRSADSPNWLYLREGLDMLILWG